MNFWPLLKQQKKPFYVLAPMDGVTDVVHREIVAITAKPDVFFTEFTNVEGLMSVGVDKVRTRLKYTENQRYIVAQLWGKNPENYYKSAQMVKSLGFDGIDINMGCPEAKVMKLKAGAALIGNNDHVTEIIKAVQEGGEGLAVSVKTRIGINTIVTEEWISFLLKHNLHALTIHGRTAQEMSKVPVHWDEIALAVNLKNKLAPDTVVLGNGDITCKKTAEEVSEKYGVDGVMIGKGIFSNPWIFEENIREHTSQEYLKLLLEHCKLYCEEYPNKRKFGPMKKFMLSYVRNFNNASIIKEQLIKTENYEDVYKVIKPYLNSETQK